MQPIPLINKLEAYVSSKSRFSNTGYHYFCLDKTQIWISIHLLTILFIHLAFIELLVCARHSPGLWGS